MGIVSGNSAKCECEPSPNPPPVPQIRNITSVALRGECCGKRQVLELDATTKVCLLKGDVARFKVKYRTANTAATSALGFKLVYDPLAWKLKSAKASTNAACGYTGTSRNVAPQTYHGQTFIPYLCTSLAGHKVVPASDASIMEVELEAKAGHEGVTTVGVEAQPHIRGNGYKYEVAPPLQMRLGHCSEQNDHAQGVQTSV